MISLVAVAEIVIELGPPVEFGVTRDGERRFTPIIGGALRGLDTAPSDSQELSELSGLSAKILTGGGDRQVVRPGGAVDIDARYDAQTESGSVIGIHVTGTRRSPVGEYSPPYFRAAIRFETADPALASLQDFLYIADGVRETSSVRHTVYRVL